MTRALALGLVGLGCAPDEPAAAPVRVPDEPPTPVVRAPSVAPATAIRSRPPPAGLVDVVAFVPHVRLAIGYATADNFTGAALPGYGSAAAWLHPAATDGLARVARELADDGLALVVYDAYRPRRATAAMIAWTRATHREDLVRDGFIASRSQHNRGLAVDVGLFEIAGGRVLEMGTPWDSFTPQAATFAVGGEPRARRVRLREAMLRHGFRPHDGEWWHFAWADGADAPALDVPYDVITPP